MPNTVDTSSDPAKENGYRPQVIIIILNWNGLEDTIECLESLSNISYSNYIITIVDNGSLGQDVQILKKKFGDSVNLIALESNLGFAGGNNKAIRKHIDKDAPEYFLLLNNDTTVDRNFLGRMVSLAETDEKIGIVGAKLLYYDCPNIVNFGGCDIGYWTINQRRKHLNEIDSPKNTRPTETDRVEGACMLVRTTMLRDIGLFDEDYFIYWEETDLCFRASQAGYHVMMSLRAKVWHKIGSSMEKIGGNKYYVYRNHMMFIKKNIEGFRTATAIIYWLFKISRLLVFLFLTFPLSPRERICKASSLYAAACFYIFPELHNSIRTFFESKA